MLLFLGYLLLRNKKDSELFENAGHLLTHLSLFFIPAGAGLILYLDVLLEQGLAILASLVLGTFVALAASAKLIQFLIDRQQGQVLTSASQQTTASAKDDTSHD